jgi:cellulose synthase operon protein C
MLLNRTSLLIAMSACASLALACGPEFPNRLLDDRSASLQNLPIGSFDFEMKRLLPEPKDALIPVEDAYYGSVPVIAPAPTAAADAANMRLAPIYERAAVEFHEGDLDAARADFNALLAMAETEHLRSSRELAALYSLGRLERAQSHEDAARTAFRRVRDRVLEGVADPQGLGAASFGEEARIELDAGDFAKAIGLYAEQAARGSSSGMSSLGFVFSKLISNESELDAALEDSMVRRLLPAYLNARYETMPAGQLDRLVAHFDQLQSPKLEGLDRLAAALYRAGSYELAGKLAQRSESAMAWWVRAKLALRSGDQAVAAASYAHAAAAFPVEEDWGYRDGENAGPIEEDAARGFSPRCRVEGESGLLALSRGDYESALEQFYASADQYWDDAAHVAERVLTVDELRQFVDTHVQVRPLALDAAGNVSWSPGQRLRTLLARRLLRDGRFEEALPYFDDPALAATARRYVDARNGARNGGRIERAQAAFVAAGIADAQGGDLLAFELDPDYSIYGGSFDLNPAGHYDDDYNWIPEERKDPDIGTSFVGEDEPARMLASRAKPLQRYHYRYTALDLAEEAADLLPARSQAYAAVLCMATGWINNSDHARGEALWLRYVRNGPYVPWAADFGRHCEAPDFAAAAKRLHVERIAQAKRLIRHFGPYAAALLAGGIGLVALIVRRRRSRRALATS